MAFRKWLLAFAVVALLTSLAVPASAQSANNVVCSTAVGGGSTHLVRAEGLAELVGDVVLNCTGGTSTLTTGTVPTINVQIFLSTDVTSRIVSTSNGVSLTEALLIIDEPGTSSNPATAQNPCTSSDINGSPATCNAPAGVAAAGQSTGLNTITGGYPTGLVPYGPAGRPNIFQGRYSSVQPNAITWLGVPFDPPGSTGVRSIRLTNIRGNASRMGTSSTLIPSQITEFISISGVSFITINNPQATVAFVTNGINPVTSTTKTFQQCLSENADFAKSTLPGGTPANSVTLTLNEGFSYAWKVRNYGQVLAGEAATIATADVNQNQGLGYETESGWVNTAFSGNGLGNAGRATQGTRLYFTLGQVPAGAQLVVPTVINLRNQAGDTVTGRAVLVSNDATSSATTDYSPAVGTWARIGNGTAATSTAVYEVVQTAVDALEYVKLPVAVAYVSNPGANVPAAGPSVPTSNATAGFAPVRTETTASDVAPVPRFRAAAGNVNTFSINICSCNVLFPFVTNQQNFDTGIAIANTSQDPFGTTGQQGTITLNFYGTPTQPAQTTTAPVPAGQILTFTLSGGGNFGITPAAGFQGYVIAQARFQYCHALAFITAAGAGATGQGVSESYLGIVLDTDAGTLDRTGQFGEVRAH